MVTEVTYDEARYIANAVFIDVRSEGEYEESHIPGAINVPIFTTSERAQVGTVYKQVGQEQAKDLGLHIASAKLPELIAEIRAAAIQKPVVVYCWRGGMRSRSVAVVLDLMGIQTYKLDRGYRGYRERVTTELAEYRLNSRCILVHGMTGTGKTDLLKLLEADGEPVIDLEAIAGHKGSAFGAIGERPNNQRTFDSLLFNQLEQIQDRPYFFMEAESQRIGRVRVPDFLWNKRLDAVHVLVEAPMTDRVERLVKQYVIEDSDVRQKLQDAYGRIESKLPTDIRKAAWTALEDLNYDEFVQLLLTHYYDPLYARTQEKYTGVITVSSEDIIRCKEQMIHIAHQHTAISDKTSASGVR